MRGLTTLVWLWAAVLLGLACTPESAGADTRADAINVAGRQRMLTQRMVKAYLAIGLDLLPERSRAELLGAEEAFAAQLARLRAGAPGESVAGALEEVERFWAEFRSLIDGPANLADAVAIDQLGERLLEAAHRVVLALEQGGEAPLDHLVNVSGRQRMLSQRLAKLYLLRLMEPGDPRLDASITVARDEFREGLEKLIAAPDSHALILDELAAVELHWAWLDSALDLREDTYRLLVLESSESILARMDAITAMYAQVAGP